MFSRSRAVCAIPCTTVASMVLHPTDFSGVLGFFPIIPDTKPPKKVESPSSCLFPASATSAVRASQAMALNNSILTSMEDVKTAQAHFMNYLRGVRNVANVQVSPNTAIPADLALLPDSAGTATAEEYARHDERAMAYLSITKAESILLGAMEQMLVEKDIMMTSGGKSGGVGDRKDASTTEAVPRTSGIFAIDSIPVNLKMQYATLAACKIALLTGNYNQYIGLRDLALSVASDVNGKASASGTKGLGTPFDTYSLLGNYCAFYSTKLNPSMCISERIPVRTIVSVTASIALVLFTDPAALQRSHLMNNLTTHKKIYGNRPGVNFGVTGRLSNCAAYKEPSGVPTTYFDIESSTAISSLLLLLTSASGDADSDLFTQEYYTYVYHYLIVSLMESLGRRFEVSPNELFVAPVDPRTHTRRNLLEADIDARVFCGPAWRPLGLASTRKIGGRNVDPQAQTIIEIDSEAEAQVDKELLERFPKLYRLTSMYNLNALIDQCNEMETYYNRRNHEHQYNSSKAQGAAVGATARELANRLEGEGPDAKIDFARVSTILDKLGSSREVHRAVDHQRYALRGMSKINVTRAELYIMYSNNTNMARNCLTNALVFLPRQHQRTLLQVMLELGGTQVGSSGETMLSVLAAQKPKNPMRVLATQALLPFFVRPSTAVGLKIDSTADNTYTVNKGLFYSMQAELMARELSFNKAMESGATHEKIAAMHKKAVLYYREYLAATGCVFDEEGKLCSADAEGRADTLRSALEAAEGSGSGGVEMRNTLFNLYFFSTNFKRALKLHYASVMHTAGNYYMCCPRVHAPAAGTKPSQFVFPDPKSQLAYVRTSFMSIKSGDGYCEIGPKILGASTLPLSSLSLGDRESAADGDALVTVSDMEGFAVPFYQSMKEAAALQERALATVRHIEEEEGRNVELFRNCGGDLPESTETPADSETEGRAQNATYKTKSNKNLQVATILRSLAILYSETRDYLYSTGLYAATDATLKSMFGCYSMQYVDNRSLRKEYEETIGAVKEAETTMSDIKKIVRDVRRGKWNL